MIKLVPTEKWHLILLNATDEVKASLYSDDYINTILANKAYTVLIDGEVYGAAGVIHYWSGVGEVWTIITDKLKSRPKTLVIVSRAIAELLFFGYNRIQASVLEGHKEGVNFIEHMGFSYEGTMKKFGMNGETYLRYARVI